MIIVIAQDVRSRAAGAQQFSHKLQATAQPLQDARGRVMSAAGKTPRKSVLAQIKGAS